MINFLISINYLFIIASIGLIFEIFKTGNIDETIIVANTKMYITKNWLVPNIMDIVNILICDK